MLAGRMEPRSTKLFIEAVWNQGRLEVIDELVAADYLGRFSWLDVEVLGPNGVRRHVSEAAVNTPTSTSRSRTR